MSARHYRSPDDTFRAPASYRREAAQERSVEPGAEQPVSSDDSRTRLLRDDGPETTPLESRVPRVDRVGETLVSPALRGRAADRAQAPREAPYDARRQVGQRRQEEVLRRPVAPAREAPAQEGYRYEQPAPRRRRPGRAGVRAILLVLSWVLRLAAIALAALVVLDAFTVGNRMTLMQLTARAAQLLPSSLAGLYVLDTPFGGAFRGDFAIASVCLFVLDWVCARIRRALA